MFLTELFDRSQDIRPATSSHGLYDIVKAYEFNVGSDTFFCYLDSSAGKGKPNTVGFMKLGTEKGHKLTNDNIPFQVFPAVVQCLRLFVQELKPETIYFSGFSAKQHVLYKKMLLRYADRIPKPYRIAEMEKHGGDGLFISRDEKFLAHSYINVLS